MTQNTEPSLKSEFTKFVEKAKPPALAAALIENGEIKERFTHGLETATSCDTAFRIASMTKVFAAAAVLLLRDEAKLSIDDPVSKFVPELRAKVHWDRTTIYHLLTMQSGLPTDDAWADRQLGCTNDELGAVFATELLLAAEPGDEYHYSNLGYMILGRIIARASGLSAQEFIKKRLLIPLGMFRTEWNRPALPACTGFALRNGAYTEDGNVDCRSDGVTFGGLWSTVNDLLLWVRFLSDWGPERERYASILSLPSRKEICP